MAVFLSPGVYPREIDISALPAGQGGLRPAFIGTAKKGPLNQPTLITSAAQYIDVFGEPFPESYLGYTVMAFMTQGNSCWVTRVGVEHTQGLPSSVEEIAIDTSGAKVEGWGRVPVFKGIDFGTIKFREVSSSNPVIIHDASITSQDYFYAGDGTAPDATLDFATEDFDGCVEEVFTMTITDDQPATDVDGTPYVVTDSSGAVVDSGTLSSSVPVDLGNGITFSVDINNGEPLAANDTFVFTAVPDNQDFNVIVNGAAVQNLTVATGTYNSASDFVVALNGASGVNFDAVVIDDVPAIRTDTAGEWIQLAGSCAFAATVGVSQYTYDIPRSFLIGAKTGPYAITSSNNRIVIDAIGEDSTQRFDFTIPANSSASAASLAAAISPNGSVGGTDYFEAFSLTVPGGTTHVVLVTTDDRKFDQLRMQATFSYLQTLRFADTVGVNFPHTRAYRSFGDSRAVLPTESTINPGAPASCDANPSDPQCLLDSAYYSNIVGWLVAKTPGTWIDDYMITIQVYTEGVGDVAGRYRLVISDSRNVVVSAVDDVTFDPSDERYIGNVINEGSTLGGVNGNEYVQWEGRPDSLGSDVRNPSPFTNRVFLGGADGIPFDPAESSRLDDAIIGNPALSTGIHGLQNPEAFDFNLLVTPGFSSGPVIAQGLQFAENRGDVLYLVDPPFGLRPQQVVDWHNGMLTSDLATALNTSYGALYWSWIRVSDQFNGGTIWIPPSGHVSAAFALTAREFEQWFAAAGTTRGAVRGVIDVEYNPTLGERDLLYGSGNAVNALVNFVQQGVTIWGNRTLQRRSTALDRVNVRMLLNFVKRNSIVTLRDFTFEQNDNVTRAQVRNILNSFLADVKARRGLTDFRVVCDTTNNTPDRIDRNELWVSVFLQPTRVAEFIVLNLVVMRTGASFGAAETLLAGGVVQ